MPQLGHAAFDHGRRPVILEVWIRSRCIEDSAQKNQRAKRALVAGAQFIGRFCCKKVLALPVQKSPAFRRPAVYLTDQGLDHAADQVNTDRTSWFWQGR